MKTALIVHLASAKHAIAAAKVAPLGSARLTELCAEAYCQGLLCIESDLAWVRSGMNNVQNTQAPLVAARAN